MVQTNSKLAVGSMAPDVEVQPCDGPPGKLSDYWSQRPLALFLTRHLGCAFCREQLVTLRDHYDEFQRAGVDLAAVLMRDRAESCGLRDRLQLPFSCLADPQYKVYDAYAAERAGLLRVMGPQIWLPAMRAMLRGGMGKVAGDVRRLPASFLISSDGLLLFAHYARHPADHPRIDRLLQCCPIAAARGTS
jgi:peroxiredoxin